MAIADRDWNRDTPTRKKVTARTSAAAIGAMLVAGLVAGLVLGAAAAHRGARVSSGFGGEATTHAAAARISILGLPSITIGNDELYEADDPWKPYLAGEQACPGGERLDLPLARQADIMVCLVNFARRRRGLQPVSTVELLNRTSVLKADKIEQCTDFNHNACGEDAAADARSAGYRGAWGENLFIAEGPWGAPRPALDGWLNSSEHRQNLFRPEWRTQGLAVMKMATFGDEHDVTLWVDEFGTS
jgi:uncharacterized protein YkwD